MHDQLVRARRVTSWLADHWWLAPVAGAVVAVIGGVIFYGIGVTAAIRWVQDGDPVDPVLDAKLTVLCKIAFLILAVVAIGAMSRRSKSGDTDA